MPSTRRITVLLTLLMAAGCSGARSSSGPVRTEPAIAADLPVRYRQADHRISIQWPTDRFATPVSAIDELEEGEVRLLDVVTPTALTVRQCSGTRDACGPALLAARAGDGHARFLFEFDENLGPGVDCRREPCDLALSSDGAAFSIPLAFGQRARLGSISVEPHAVEPGDEVQVSLVGFAPGPVTVAVCVPPGPVDPQACGDPGPERRVEIGGDGGASVWISVPDGLVGRRRVACDRTHRCGVAVVTPVQTRVAEFRFVDRAEPRLAGARAAIAGGAAMLLLGIALLLARRFDWGTPDGDPFAEA